MTAINHFNETNTQTSDDSMQHHVLSVYVITLPRNRHSTECLTNETCYHYMRQDVSATATQTKELKQ